MFYFQLIKTNELNRNNMENYYLKIKEYRLRNNHTTAHIAIQMEISEKSYKNIEEGTIDLKLSKLDKLVKILGIKKSEIFKSIT